mmetsp:Transcript_95064/g.277988  ORF Transcript_95064/g.277988 Transcript_95064/m.277988 type:complete len:239 (+) Transcript_95064:851-1567(+)
MLGRQAIGAKSTRDGGVRDRLRRLLLARGLRLPHAAAAPALQLPPDARQHLAEPPLPGEAQPPGLAAGREPRPAGAVPAATPALHHAGPPLRADAQSLEHSEAGLQARRGDLQRAREPALRVELRGGGPAAGEGKAAAGAGEVPGVHPQPRRRQGPARAARRAGGARGLDAAQHRVPAKAGERGREAQHDRPEGHDGPGLPGAAPRGGAGRGPAERGGGASGALPPAPADQVAGDPAH